MVEITLEFKLQTENIILSLYIGKKLNNWEIVEDFDAKMYSWVKNLLYHELFMLVRWKILLSREHTKRALYV
jgi:hypothetical protein